MCLINNNSKDNTDSINNMKKIMNTIFSRLTKDELQNSLIISNKFKFPQYENIPVLTSYNKIKINECFNKSTKKVIFMDLSVGIDVYSYDFDNLLDILLIAKDKNAIVVLYTQVDDVLLKITNNCDHITLLKSTDIKILKLIYQNAGIKSLFSSFESFDSIFNQLVNKFGAMIISNKENAIYWHRL